MTTEADDKTPTAASPYSTGGGGTVLEHRYGAVLLAHLLTGDPVTELGDDLAPVQVAFQASAFSPVDDLVVSGRSTDGTEHRVSIGVRRNPSLVPSDEPSVQLLASYLRVVSDHWSDVQAGRWRLALAVASPNAAVRQVAALAEIARDVPNEATFRADVARPGRTNQATRRRLAYLHAVVAAAAAHTGIDTSALPAGELTWRLLSALRVRELRLEGVDETDRTVTVGRLREVTRDGTPAAADALFSRLAELAGRYAPAAAVKTQATLRRDLAGTPLGRSPAWAQAWAILDRLARRLRDRTGSRLSAAAGDLELDRVEARRALAAALTEAAIGGETLVVIGEPDVGKSALALRATEELQAAGIAVAALSLRDLPGTTVELESLLGGALVDVLGGEAVDQRRLLLIDGAEAVLEGRGPLLADLVAAAFRAGLGVAAVTRTDAARAVADALHQAAEAVDPAGTGSPPAEHEVPQLSPVEVERITSTFASVARLGGEPRAAWLLARPGLVDLLLRADATLALPDGALSEADVFAAIWHRLVRHQEVTPQGGPSPDARERALTLLARRLLLPDSPAAAAPESAALPSLRSDGLLLAAGPTGAWNPGDQFATDLVRDLSVARLLRTDGWAVLTEAGAPRWALRAARLACQATLAAAGPDTERARTQLQQVFDALAAEHGARWAELPLEAMLTLGSARDVLAAAWPALAAGQREGVATLLRLALDRYSRHGAGDSIILAPLVQLIHDHWDELGGGHRYTPPGGIGEQVQKLVLAWLRGLAAANAGTVPLRQRVRDTLLDAGPEGHDEFAVEALASLGTDLDARAEAFLRDLASDGGDYLAPAVESVHAVVALSASHPELLVALAEAYYIAKPQPDDPWSSGYDSLGDGVRRHTTTGGIGEPMAGWYLGPFFRLLHTRPNESLGMINRLLDHAAAVRIDQLRRYDPEAQPGDTTRGLNLDLPGVGPRLCIGDPHVWSWYRGSSVGPYPCMSALLAVERFADHLVDTLGFPLQNVTEVLLRDCHNLAMPGLVVGLLVRHLDRVSTELDQWLTRPEIWHLEFSRATAEFTLHVQGPDDAATVGHDRRGYNFRDVAGQLIVRAILAGDQDRLAVLHKIGDELLRRAQELTPNDGEELTTVALWAGGLDVENYRLVKLDNGRTGIQYQPPPEVAAGLQASGAEIARGQQATSLVLRYTHNEDRSAPVDILADDLALARTFATDPPSHGLHPQDAVAGTAAAAIVAHAHGRAQVADDDICWAADVLVEAALNPPSRIAAIESSIYPMGADRSAAVGLPALLLPPFATAQVDRAAIERGIVGCATSLFDEVRRALAVGLAPVWQAPCDDTTEGGRCRHQIAWRAVEAGLRDCRLGAWNQQRQRRDVDPLDGPPTQTLPTVPTDRLLVNRLTGPLVASADAARSGCCVADQAQRLLDALLDAHRRGATHWATKGYGWNTDQDHRRVARVLLALAVDGDSEPLATHVRAFAGNAPALRQLLDDLSLLSTYDADLRHGLPTVWPTIMQIALDAIDAGSDPRQDDHWGDWAIASLIPHPGLDSGDRNADATLKAASRDWIDPHALDGLVARWLPIARGSPRALDALLGLVVTAPTAWQATTGLRWVEELIGGNYTAIATRSWRLPDWLEQLRISGQLEPPDTAVLQRIIDGLAAHGDTRAVALQRADE